MFRPSRLVLVGLLSLACSSDQPTAPAETCTIRGLSLAQTAFVMTVGQGVTVPAAIDQAGCRALPAVAWSSSDPSVVTATNDGTITAVGVGSATVTAKLDGRNDQASATVTVRGRILGLSLTPATATIDVASSLQLAPAVTADPGTSTALRWSSSDPSRATVDSSGRVTGVGAGSTTITVSTMADTSRRATMTLTVRPRVLSVRVSPERDTLFVTDTLVLRATVLGDSGFVPTVTWRSLNPSVASISAAGTVTALSAGHAELVATSTIDTVRRATAVVLVLPRVLGLTVSPEVATLNVGATQALVATVTGDSGRSTAVTWRSVNPAIATVAATGVVTGIAPGNTTVIVRSVADTTRFAQASISVRARVLGVSVVPTQVSMLVGGTTQLNATVSGDPGISTGVTWSTGNAAIATVSAQGVVTGIGAGTTSITATAVADPTKRANASVTVTQPAPPPPPPPPPPAEGLCFGSTDSGVGQRVLPGVGVHVAAFGCTSSLVDLLPGQTFGAFAMVDGAAIPVAWQVPPTSAASFSTDPDALVIHAMTPGTVTVSASAGGRVGALTIRVLSAAPSGFCLSTAPGGPCATAATAKAGQPVTAYGVASGQGVGTAMSVLNVMLSVPPHLVTGLTFVPPVPGIYTVLGSPTAGGGGAVLVVTVTP